MEAVSIFTFCKSTSQSFLGASRMRGLFSGEEHLAWHHKVTPKQKLWRVGSENMEMIEEEWTCFQDI